jgi:hypothetical protein
MNSDRVAPPTEGRKEEAKAKQTGTVILIDCKN